MQKNSNLLIKVVLVICLGTLPGVFSGCGSTKTQKQQNKATIQYITKDNRMERILFNDGFLRSTPEITSGTIVINVYKGSQGMMYGKRFINGMYWAKVTTREGVTGWYSPGDKPGQEANTDLSTTQKNFSMTYPVISGISSQAEEKINKEITEYVEAFKFVAGPVGNTLQCRITYNKDNLLSILFTSGAVRNRIYKVTDVNNHAFWTNIIKYCFIPELNSDMDKVNLVAPITDLQYAMVFSLQTGDRLSYDYFIGNNSKKQDFFRKLGNLRQKGTDCFYLEPGGKLWAYFEREKGPETGRKLVDLSSLVTKKF